MAHQILVAIGRGRSVVRRARPEIAAGVEFFLPHAAGDLARQSFDQQRVDRFAGRTILFAKWKNCSRQ